MTITDDIVFYISGSSLSVSVIFDEWVTTSDLILDSVTLSQQLVFERNGISGMANASISVSSNRNYADTTVKDGWVTLNGVSTVSGDVLTIKAGVYTFPGALGFNTKTVQVFTGAAFVINPVTLFSISNTVLIPEPSTLLLSCVGVIGLFNRRR